MSYLSYMMSNQKNDPINKEQTVGLKRPSVTHDTSPKKQKSSLDILKLGRPNCKIFIGKANQFSETISKKLAFS